MKRFKTLSERESELKIAILPYFICLFLINGCATTSSSTPESQLGALKKSFDDGHYEYVVSKLGEYKTKYPDSQETPTIMLMLADSRFNLGEYEEAIFDYEEFKTLYPDHPRTDYAQFQVGHCYWKESSDLVDQDQEFTRQAMAEWSKLIESYPASSYVDAAKKKILLGKQRLLGQEIFVAKYYCRTKQYTGCVYRNLKIADKYSAFPDIVKAANQRAGKAMRALIEKKRADPEADHSYVYNDMSLEQMIARSNELLSAGK